MIAIVDCNSFYCSCERLFRPDLLHTPVVVLSNNDGCIISRTDEAKALGIAMGAPFFMVKEQMKKNNIVPFSSNYFLYGNMSHRVMDILKQICGDDKVEVYSIDEAFIDLSHIPEKDLDAIAKAIKETVEMWTGIPVSIGIAKTKTLAKVANRLSKKDKIKTGCIVVIHSEEELQKVLQECAVDNIWGVGRANAKKLEAQGILTAWQLANVPEDWAQKNLGGVVGIRLIRELNGQPSIFLQEELVKKKMITTSRMFGRPVIHLKEIEEAIATYVSRAAEKLRRQHCAAGSMSIFMIPQARTTDNHFIHGPTISAHCYLPVATSCTNTLISHAMPLAKKIYTKGPVYKKAGVILGDIVPDNVIQQNLFAEEHQKENSAELMKMIDNVNFSMRNDVLKFATTGTRQFWKMKQEHRSLRFTTRWEELKEIG